MKKERYMTHFKFNKELYPKSALIKAAYNFTDIAFLHLDADEVYYYVSLEAKDTSRDISEKEFMNEMLAQSVRHLVYTRTKNIRELLLARSLATSVVAETNAVVNENEDEFSEEEILKNWEDIDEDYKY